MPDHAVPDHCLPGQEPGGGLAAVLFDMDGLLVGTEPLWYEAERLVMGRLGGDWSPADQYSLVGGSLPKTVRYLIERARRPATAEQVGEWLLGEMLALLASGPLPLLPGIGDLLAQVQGAGLAHALVTSSEREIMTAVLAAAGVRFPVTVCGQDVRAAKPDPEPYLLAAARLGVDPAACAALEDSPNGVAAALAAGCRTVAIPGLVPVAPRPGLLITASATELSLDRLRALMAVPSPGAAVPR